MKLTKSRSAAILLAAGAPWFVIGYWAAPWLISQAYRGESLPILNDAFAGRGVFPVERYLDAWYSLFLTLTIVLGMGGAVAWLSYRFPDRRRRLISAVVGGRSSIHAGGLLWYAVILGAASGVGEAVYRGVRQAITTRPAAGFFVELFWMAPLSSALAGLVVGLLMLGLAAMGSTRWDLGKATLLLASLGVYGVLQSEGIPLHPVAAATLALGIAATLARGVSPRVEVVSTAITRARPYFGVAVVSLAAVAWYLLPSNAEARAARGRPSAREGLPNVLVVVLDAVRASSLGLYGYERDTAPRLGEWAKSGAVFDFAIAPAPWTLPSHASVFTGRYNAELRTGFTRPLDETFPTLAEVLRDQGYATAGFVANLLYTTDMSGLQRGFDRWEDYPLGTTLFLSSSWLSRAVTRRVAESVGWTGSGGRSASDVTREFLDWRERQGRRPFFAFINYFDAHDPYVSPRSEAQFTPFPRREWDTFLADWRSDPSVEYSPDHARRWINMYDNAITYIDRHLGTMRAALEASGELDNTIVVVTADHGEMWGEHGLLGHAQALYLPVLRVPLIIWHPGPEGRGERVDARVSLRDLPSTILDLAGLDATRLPGHSLAPLLRGEQGPPLSPRIAELDHDPYNANPWDPVSRGDMKSVVRRPYHYIVNGDGVVELYDFISDPDETEDISDEPASAPVLAQFEALLDSIQKAAP